MVIFFQRKNLNLILICLELISHPLTRIPSRRDNARNGRNARNVRIVLNAGMFPKPAMPTMIFNMETFFNYYSFFLLNKNRCFIKENKVI